MIKRIAVVSAAAVVLAALSLAGAGWSTAEGSDQAKLPGDAGPGPYAQGCVDCHSQDGAEKIGAALAGLKHKNVDKEITEVPADCLECHSKEGDYTPLSELAHMLHFENPAENAFVQTYGGNCLHCHSLDPESGVITVKSGSKNW